MSNPHAFGVTLPVGSSLANRTGDWRVQRPVYVSRRPPCNEACPAGEDIQGWLYRAEEGDYEEAWRLLVRENPLPAVMGRVCYRPCETACSRGRVDEAVGVNSVERFLGDEALKRGWDLESPGEPTGWKVLVIGAGPCGLSAAYHLRLAGHTVTVADSASAPGGMMRNGIPAYRLPRRVMEAEVDRIVGTGVDLRLDERVTDAERAMGDGGFDACLVAVGAQLSHRVEIPAGDSARIVDALQVLKGAAGGDLRLGRRVAVYGGGDTALDAARTAARLGATDPVIIYRRDRARMPAHAEQLEEALAEGVAVRWLSTIRRADAGRLVLERMQLDGSGLPRPTGEVEELEADTLVLAVGEESDLSVVAGTEGVSVSDGVIAVADDLMTGHPGIFAGGDAAPGERSVTRAVGDGARAARRIDGWLSGREAPAPPTAPPATFERLNLWYYSEAPRTLRPRLEAARRRSVFDEVVGGLDEDNALFEARRCLSCGNCLECDNCYGVCPDNAVIKLGPGLGYEIDYDYCKGCGICAAECPCGAIDMEPEEI